MSDLRAVAPLTDRSFTELTADERMALKAEFDAHEIRVYWV